MHAAGLAIREPFRETGKRTVKQLTRQKLQYRAALYRAFDSFLFLAQVSSDLLRPPVHLLLLYGVWW